MQISDGFSSLTSSCTLVSPLVSTECSDGKCWVKWSKGRAGNHLLLPEGFWCHLQWVFALYSEPVPHWMNPSCIVVSWFFLYWYKANMKLWIVLEEEIWHSSLNCSVWLRNKIKGSYFWWLFFYKISRPMPLILYCMHWEGSSSQHRMHVVPGTFTLQLCLEVPFKVQGCMLAAWSHWMRVWIPW